MGGLWQDVKFGVRMLAKNPGFTATAVITLALAIGANTAVFSVVDPLLLRKLPVEKPDELVLLGMAGSLETNSVSEDTTYQIYRDENHVFAGIFASSDAGDQTVSYHGGTFSADGELVTGSYFSVLGVRPFQGRLISPTDDVPPLGRQVVVLSFDFARRIFGRDSSAAGQIVVIYGVPFSVIGVTPPEFFGTTVGRSPDFYVPMAAVMGQRKAREPGLAPWLTIMGRLKPNETIAQAFAGLQPLFEDAKRQSRVPEVEKAQDMARLVLTPAARGLEELREQFSLSGKLLLAAVAFILILACANVTNLLLARGMERRRELTVRLALGASRTRVLRQLATETSLLTVAGGAAGLWAAVSMSRALAGGLSTRRAPFLLKTGLDLRVLTFAVLVCLGASLLTGIAPAFLSLRREISEELKVHSKSSRESGGLRLTTGMMIAQVAVSVIILAATGLLVHSLTNMERFDVGFSKDSVLSISFSVRPGPHSDEQMKAIYGDLLTRTTALPGVKSASLATITPVTGGELGINVAIEGETPRASSESHVFLSAVSPGYFGTMGIRLLSGRDFTEHDAPGFQSVAVINRTMALHYFGEQDAIGKRFRFVEGNRPPLEIIGVVADSKYADLRETTPDFVYTPMGPRATVRTSMFVRANGGAAALKRPIEKIMQSLNARVALNNIATMKEEIDESLHQDRLVAALSGGFSLLALVLTAVGLFGVLAFSVARRTSEIGVRMALGARPADIFRLIVGNGMAVVAIGLAIGAAGALAAGRVLQSILFHVSGTDPVAFGAVTIVLLAAAFLACYLPARRASRVDPMAALRSE